MLPGETVAINYDINSHYATVDIADDRTTTVTPRRGAACPLHFQIRHPSPDDRPRRVPGSNAAPLHLASVQISGVIFHPASTYYVRVRLPATSP